MTLGHSLPQWEGCEGPPSRIDIEKIQVYIGCQLESTDVGEFMHLYLCCNELKRFASLVFQSPTVPGSDGHHDVETRIFGNANHGAMINEPMLCRGQGGDMLTLSEIYV